MKNRFYTPFFALVCAFFLLACTDNKLSGFALAPDASESEKPALQADIGPNQSAPSLVVNTKMASADNPSESPTALVRADANAHAPANATGSPQQASLSVAASNHPASTNTARKIIRNYSFRLEVTSFDKALANLEKLAESSGGYIVNSSKQQEDNAVSLGHIQLRIPLAAATKSISEIRALGKVLGESSGADDITESYADMQARLNNAKASEARLLELYKRSAKLAEVVELEKAISQTRAEIEAQQAKQKTWDTLLAYSTIDIDIFEPRSAIPGANSFWTPITDAFSDSLLAFSRSINSVIIFIGATLPWLVLGLFAWWLFRILGGKRVLERLAFWRKTKTK